MEEPTKPKPAKAKKYRTKSGGIEHIPGLGFKVTDEMLQKPFVIKAIENFEARTGKTIFGTVVVLD
jgi:hypothetical protein